MAILKVVDNQFVGFYDRFQLAKDYPDIDFPLDFLRENNPAITKYNAIPCTTALPPHDPSMFRPVLKGAKKQGGEWVLDWGLEEIDLNVDPTEPPIDEVKKEAAIAENDFLTKEFFLWRSSSPNAGWTGTLGLATGFSQSIVIPSGSPGNEYLSYRRARYSHNNTPFSAMGQRSADPVGSRGNGLSFFSRLGFGAWTNGGRFFAGFVPTSVGNNAVINNPMMFPNAMGFVIDKDDGVISFLSSNSSGAMTLKETRFRATSNNGFELSISCQQRSSNINWQIREMSKGGVESGTVVSGIIPNESALLAPIVSAGNGALSLAGAVQLEIALIYAKTH